jgi:sulfur-oxidizing protein SoxY
MTESLQPTPSRRRFLEAGLSAVTIQLLLNAGVLNTAQAATTALESQSSLDTAFQATQFKVALKALGANPTHSSNIILTAPDVAENGASVDIAVESNLPNTTDIYILVAKNPNPLAAVFHLDGGTIPEIRLFIRMSESSAIHAVVKADGKFYSAIHDTQVTVGGCLGG